jgi:hypothetical protein
LSKKRDVVAAPMSFAGSLARAQNWLWHEQELWFKIAVGWWAVGTLVMMWWLLIVLWYMIFGLLLVPYRLIRRGSRKQKIQTKQHRELLEALKNNKNS